ncbi:MAG: phosphotransferase [Steroidobacterales bacterium]
MLDPEGLAQQSVPGRGKPLVRLVARGLQASTYSVRRDGRRYAMRLPLAPAAIRPAAAAPPWEQRVFTAAAQAGLGPAIRHSDPASGIVVTEWVRGRRWTRAEVTHGINIRRFAMLVRRIQALSPLRPHYARQPADWIHHYREIAGRGGAIEAFAAGLAGEAERQLELLARLPAHPDVLCHSDLHRHNLIDGAAGLIALDWEYAHFSDPYWDLAGWLSANDLGALHRERLLAGFLGRGPDRAQIERLTRLTWLYDYVCVLWSHAYRGQFAAPVGAAVARRARKLMARLSRA